MPRQSAIKGLRNLLKTYDQSTRVPIVHSGLSESSEHKNVADVERSSSPEISSQEHISSVLLSDSILQPGWHDEDAISESSGPYPTTGAVVVYEPEVQKLQVHRLDIEELLDLRLPKLRKVLTKEQFRALPLFLEELFKGGGSSVQCIAPTGVGKTYEQLAITLTCRELRPDLFPYNRFILVLLPTAVVMKTTRLFAQYGLLTQNVLIRSIDSMRAGIGDCFLEWKTFIINEQPTIYPVWPPNVQPCLILLDESQKVKNEDSDQAKIIESAGAHNIPVVPFSATPYSRACQAKVIACILKPEVEFGLDKHCKLTPAIWHSWVKGVCHPHDPNEWSPEALKRVQSFLEPKTVRFTCEYPHRILTKTVACTLSAERRIIYDRAFADWQAIREQQAKNPLIGFAAVLVALQKFLQVAEELGVPERVKYALQLYNTKNADKKCKLKPSIIFGFANRTSLDIAIGVLTTEYKIPRDKIAVVVGGQSQSERDRNVQAFQTDRVHILCMTIQCGGAGLDLDHNESNYRQRFMFVSAVWNDLQMVQLAGRCQRIFSKSATYMYILYHTGTEEYKRLRRVMYKVRSLKEITTKVKVQDVEGEGGSFVDSQMEHTSIRQLGPTSDEEEESAAQSVIGTGSGIQFDMEEEEE